MSAAEILNEDQPLLEVETAWKHEALERCKAFDEGHITERDATDVLRDAAAKYQAANLTMVGKTV